MSNFNFSYFILRVIHRIWAVAKSWNAYTVILKFLFLQIFEDLASFTRSKEFCSLIVNVIVSLCLSHRHDFQVKFLHLVLESESSLWCGNHLRGHFFISRKVPCWKRDGNIWIEDYYVKNLPSRTSERVLNESVRANIRTRSEGVITSSQNCQTLHQRQFCAFTVIRIS